MESLLEKLLLCPYAASIKYVPGPFPPDPTTLALVFGLFSKDLLMVKFFGASRRPHFGHVFYGRPLSLPPKISWLYHLYEYFYLLGVKNFKRLKKLENVPKIYSFVQTNYLNENSHLCV